MTQEEVAERVGVPRSSIARWETGASWPDPNRLVRLCALLKAYPEELKVIRLGMLIRHDQQEAFSLVKEEVESLAESIPSDALAALHLLLLESKLWNHAKGAAGRKLLAATYRIHSAWLESIGRPSSAAIYLSRAESLEH